MLVEIDRIQIAVADRGAAAHAWTSLLGAEPADEDRLPGLSARRSRLRIAQGFVELLEADGAGAVADALARRNGPHLFAAGASTSDLGGLAARLDRRGIGHLTEGGQIHLAGEMLGVPGLNLVVSPHAERPSVGLIDILYEATLLNDGYAPAVARLAETLGIDRRHEVVITSDRFGYDGLLTLFRPDALHRFEVIAPTRDGTTMARQLAKLGPALYMAFGESRHIGEIEARARTAGAGLTVDRPAGRAEDAPADQLWLHPGSLGGVMLGVSRPTMAWHWSGQPARVEAVA
ncbi:hypothetical protein [Chelatococcus reniformis]|uniref:VOC domain-containing protein n=1 Tax=Chelatococcus reniformis TaxID=1494448 RepID=A0A916XMG4_9HYPH|nr:hypothetical protein [Chelatococcus reniformis]GGC83985.1 hypothetical protein GCM10010994_47350 [Chelatococcus reniformis]